MISKLQICLHLRFNVIIFNIKYIQPLLDNLVLDNLINWNIVVFKKMLQDMIINLKMINLENDQKLHTKEKKFTNSFDIIFSNLSLLIFNKLNQFNSPIKEWIYTLFYLLSYCARTWILIKIRNISFTFYYWDIRRFNFLFT